MPTTTPCKALPYPVGSDAPDVAGDLQRLALAIDTVLCNLQTKAVGELFHFYDTGRGLPDDALLCDGSTFSASNYPALNTHLGGNQLPDLRGRFLMMANTTYPMLSRGGYTDHVLLEHTHGGAPHTHGMNHAHTASASSSGTVGATDINHRHRYDHGHPDNWSGAAGNHSHVVNSPAVNWLGHAGGGDLGVVRNADTSIPVYAEGVNLLSPSTNAPGDHQHYLVTPSTGAIWSDWMWEGNPHGHALSVGTSVTVNQFSGATATAAYTGNTSGAAGQTVIASGAGRNLPPYAAVAILIQAR